jgi:hypothetical protein
MVQRTMFQARRENGGILFAFCSANIADAKAVEQAFVAYIQPFDA